MKATATPEVDNEEPFLMGRRTLTESDTGGDILNSMLEKRASKSNL